MEFGDAGDVLVLWDWEVGPVEEELSCLRGFVRVVYRRGEKRERGLTAGPGRPWSCALMRHGIGGRLCSERIMLTTWV